ncbi:MAG: sigma-70 family RNA polymerase sigma factor [Oscillospiraceae bacterium]|nr:sigma-70 family RNA polymerase sigma factor [Oscillospiraceae bacterium]
MEVLPLRTDGEMDAVIQKYQSMVYGLAFAKTGSKADADDVFQETFLAYFQAEKRFRDEEHRKAWLLRTALNMSRRVTASTWRQKTLPLESAESVAQPFREAEENRVWKALQSLSEDYRLPIYLFYFEELSTREIAKVLSIRPGTVRTRLSRGREQLRQTLKGAYFDE